jgi:sec-independent protein translocase protein TatB
MFDVGFSELMLIAVVALLVLGPERLPKVARTAGHLLGRLQRYVNDVKADINREMQLDELRKMQQQMETSVRDIETSVNKELTSVEADLNQSIDAADLASLPVPLAEPAPTLQDQAEVQAATGEASPQLELGPGGAPAMTTGKS